MPRRELFVGVSVCPVRTPTLPPATHTNTWILGAGSGSRSPGSRGVTVIDPASPWSDEQERLHGFLDDVEVERIVLTHHHHDHTGGAAALREATGAPVLAHAETAARVPLDVDGLLKAGNVLEVQGAEWRVMFTPGHAPGHVCLVREDPDGRIIVAGDMIAGVGTIVLAPPEGDLALYLDSLERLAALGPSVLLPAHGPAIPDGVAYLRHYRDHRNMRTRQIVAALAGGAASPMEIVPRIYPDIPTAVHPLAASQIRCHLSWLQAAGRVTWSGERAALAEGVS